MIVQMLHNVGVCEPVGRAWRLEVLKLLQRLIAKIVTIHEKEDTFGTRVLYETVGERTGRECFTRASCQLNEGARAVLAQ